MKFQKKSPSHLIPFLLLLFILFMPACLLSPKQNTLEDAQSAPFVPATLSPTSTSTVPPTSIPAAATSPADCANVLSYLDDLSIPDGTLVKPGQILDKQWKVINNGTCNWNEQYSLRLTAGSPMGAESQQPLYPARVGSPAVIQISFTAPDEPGSYRSAWQAYTPQGEPFGDPIFIEIEVEEP